MCILYNIMYHNNIYTPRRKCEFARHRAMLNGVQGRNNAPRACYYYHFLILFFIRDRRNILCYSQLLCRRRELRWRALPTGCFNITLHIFNNALYFTGWCDIIINISYYARLFCGAAPEYRKGFAIILN